MKQVLIVSPDFIPHDYPSSLRIMNFVRHLMHFGWQPTVVTVKPECYEFSSDRGNGQLLPQSVEIIRTSAFPSKLTRKVGIGDIGLRSLWYHWREVSRLCQRRKPDLLFISIPPYFSAILGRMIHDTYGVPYVIDYIDPWVTLNYWKRSDIKRTLKRNLSYKLSRILEPFVLRHVSHIVGVSKGTTDPVISRYSWLEEKDATEIPYGGEGADFDYVLQNRRVNRIFNPNDGLIHVSSVGRAGEEFPSLEAIFQAFKLALKRSPKIFSRVRFHFVGTTYAPEGNGHYQVLSTAERIGLKNFVDEYPQRVPYLDALKILLDSRALLALGSGQPHYTASKIFHYILARKPLLAVFHEASSVVRILEETRAGQTVTFNSQHPPIEKVEEISRRLEEILYFLQTPPSQPVGKYSSVIPHEPWRSGLQTCSTESV